MTASPTSSFEFEFNTTLSNPDTFLYNTGPIESLTDTSWNRRQTYSVTRCQGPGQGGGPGVVPSGAGAHGPRRQPAVPAVQHRATVDA